MNPLFNIDFYKAGHRQQYPKGTELVYSNFTPRSARLFKGSKFYDNKVVVLGIQQFITQFLIEDFNTHFFNKSKETVVAEYRQMMDECLGEGAVPVDHIEALHDLGYLPVKISALPEGRRVPVGVPVLTIHNTLPEFFWLVNYLETVMSSELWAPMTTATIAFEYKRILTDAAERTGASLDFVPLQAHDFSFRGLSSRETAAKSQIGHLASFIGTDTVPSIAQVKRYYGSHEIVGVSVPATEHSVMCAGGMEAEIETFRRLIEDVYPTGIVSIVSDTWDFWQVVTEYLPQLKDKIMARQPNAIGLNKVVIRPDSGDPVRIICGYAPDEYYEEVSDQATEDKFFSSLTGKELTEHEIKGAIQCLWETFGGTETDKGYKLLDEHIGLIYGDSITLERCQEIVDRLAAKGFASTNVVFGVGSYTYQYNTRDTFGFAMKATAVKVNGEYRDIFKDPKTDNGTKKSAKGFIEIVRDDDSGDYTLVEGVPTDVALNPQNYVFNEMEVVFEDSVASNRKRWEQVKDTLASEC